MNVVAHNLYAMNANRQYNVVTRGKAKMTERLSSGYRINRAADDAAGLAISEKMRRQINGLTQASRNAQDGISLVQIADGAMAEVDEMLHRGTQLSIQAANDTLSDDDRKYIQQELDQLREEIDQIKEKTTFNEIAVLKGEDVEVETSAGGASVLGGLPAWVGIDGTARSDKYMSSTYTTNETYTYTDSNGDPQTGTASIDHPAVVLDFDLGSDPATVASRLAELTQDNSGFYSTCCTCNNHYSIQFVNGGGNSTEQSPPHYIFKVDIAGATTGGQVVDKVLAAVGSNPNSHYTKLAKDGDKLVVYDNRSKSSTPINDAKALSSNGKVTWTTWSGIGAGDTATASPSRGIFGEGVAVNNSMIPPTIPHDIELQIGAESGQTLKIKLPSISAKNLHVDNVNVTTVPGANRAISTFKSALHYVNQERSRMGAYQNRLEHTIKNLDNVVENTTAAESRIRDTDMAKMMVEYANANILDQAGISIMAQANQMNSNVLSLLS